MSKNQAGPSKVSKKKSKKAPTNKERKVVKWKNICTDVSSEEEVEVDDVVEEPVVDWSDLDDEDSANISTVEHLEPQARNIFPEISKIQIELDDDKRERHVLCGVL